MREVPAEMAAKLRAAAEPLLGSFDQIQMSDIAVAAGVARSSMYYYFTNKDDILAFFLAAVLDELSEVSAAAAEGPGDPPTRLAAVIRAQLECLDRHPAASQQIIANLGRAGRLADITARAHLELEGPIRRLLIEGAADGTLRDLPDPELAATALFGAITLVGLRALVVQGRINVGEILMLVEPLVWHGIVPTPTQQ